MCKNESDKEKLEKKEVLEFIIAMGYLESDLLCITDQTKYKGDFILKNNICIEHTTFEMCDFNKKNAQLKKIKEVIEEAIKGLSFHTNVCLSYEASCISKNQRKNKQL